MIKYPTYEIRARWSETLRPDRERNRFIPDPLPEGRTWDTISWTIMFREERTVEQIIEDTLRDWWPKFSLKRPESADLTVTAEPTGWATWCLDWFSHWTFDTGLSDADVLLSFASYVDSVLDSDLTRDKSSCILMGAEDSWRWHGHTDGQDHQSPAPCRCPGCKSLGYVRIDH